MRFVDDSECAETVAKRLSTPAVPPWTIVKSGPYRGADGSGPVRLPRHIPPVSIPGDQDTHDQIINDVDGHRREPSRSASIEHPRNTRGAARLHQVARALPFDSGRAYWSDTSVENPSPLGSNTFRRPRSLRQP